MPVQPMDPTTVAGALARFDGRRAFLHFEFPTGGFARNVTAQIRQALLRGDGPYRVALRCEADGWVMMEGLTHYALSDGGALFLGALESDQRLSRALQLSLEPFTP